MAACHLWMYQKLYGKNEYVSVDNMFRQPKSKRCETDIEACACWQAADLLKPSYLNSYHPCKRKHFTHCPAPTPPIITMRLAVSNTDGKWWMTGLNLSWTSHTNSAEELLASLPMRPMVPACGCYMIASGNQEGCIRGSP